MVRVVSKYEVAMNSDYVYNLALLPIPRRQIDIDPKQKQGGS